MCCSWGAQSRLWVEGCRGLRMHRYLLGADGRGRSFLRARTVFASLRWEGQIMKPKGQWNGRSQSEKCPKMGLEDGGHLPLSSWWRELWSPQPPRGCRCRHSANLHVGRLWVILDLGVRTGIMCRRPLSARLVQLLRAKDGGTGIAALSASGLRLFAQIFILWSSSVTDL